MKSAYLVRTKDEREWLEPITDDGLGPVEPYWPTGIFVAETPAQAKRDALKLWSFSGRSGVYSDDWPNLRVRLLRRDVEYPRGEVADSDEALWLRVHEVFDHDGAACSCPYLGALDTGAERSPSAERTEAGAEDPAQPPSRAEASA